MTPTPIPSPEREPGWYHIKRNDPAADEHWTMARWFRESWDVGGYCYRGDDAGVQKWTIGPRIPSPDERPAPAAVAPELVARLRELDAKATPAAPVEGPDHQIHKHSPELWAAPISSTDENEEWQWAVALGLTKDIAVARRNFIVALVNAAFDGTLALGEAGWSDDMDAAPRDGTRLILGWNDTAALPMHCEMGRFRSGTGAGSGWCNTYGHAFSGSPTHWMRLPEPPALRRPAPSEEK